MKPHILPLRVSVIALTSLLSALVFPSEVRAEVKAIPRSAAEELPFHAVWQGNANPFPIDQCTLGNHETGSGLALHLGQWTWSDSETVHFVGCPPPPPGSAIADSGQFTITAANGDQITGTFETTGTLDPVLGVSVQGGYTFVSGTGRFVNVSGSGLIQAHGAGAPPFEFVASMDGTIRFAGP
jgi:hypothetical protein